eukprot:m.41624 g.41624  ORF g.41624 m.41624 type:complete len:448 (+) comp6051_c0_seq3:1224-2567(+)
MGSRPWGRCERRCTSKTPRAMGSRFEQNFWGEDFTSFDGFETLCKRLKEGKQVCDDYHNFCKTRASIEETYGKALVKLAKSAGGALEIGTTKSAWEKMKSELEEIGNQRLRLARQISDELEKPAKDFRERQRDQRKKTEETVKKAQKYKLSTYDKTMKARKSYEQKCRESDKLQDDLSRGSLLPAKELDKLKARARKAKAAAETADALYQDAVKQLEDARILWEREMERCCIQFQASEEARISFLRSSMWDFCNFTSASFLNEDEHLEQVRCALEQCDVDADIKLFIELRATGTKRPAPIQYVNFYGNSTKGASAYSELVGGSLKRSSASVSQLSINSTSSAGSAVIAAEPAPASAAAAPAAAPAAASPAPAASAAHAASPFVTPAANPPAHYVIAAFDYDAQGAQELTLKAGDRIRVLSKVDATWWSGELPDGRKGVFPCTYINEE